MIGVRVVNVNPDVSSSVSGFEVKDQWTGEFDATYFFTPNIAVEGGITWAKQDVSFNGKGSAPQDDAGDVHAAVSFHRPRRV